MTDIFGLSYAGFTLLGGLIGLLKAGSVASLVASTVCASAIYYGVSQNAKVNGDPRIVFGVSLLLLGFFGNKYRFEFDPGRLLMDRKTGKVMPALVMTLYSLAAVINYGRLLL